MSELPSAPRRCTEEEVAHVLERAAELAGQASPLVSRGDLTLAEVEEIAAEAGIDVELVRQAADELRSGWRSARLFGAPVRISRERTLPFEADSERFDRLLPLMQAAVGQLGRTRQAGRTLTWSHVDEQRARSTDVTVASGSGRTLVRVEERFGRLAVALFGGVLGGAGGGLGLGGMGALIAVSGPTPAVFAFPAVMMAGAYVACRAAFRHTVRKRQQVVAGLVRDLAEAVTRQHRESAAT